MATDTAALPLQGVLTRSLQLTRPSGFQSMSLGLAGSFRETPIRSRLLEC